MGGNKNGAEAEDYRPDRHSGTYIRSRSSAISGADRWRDDRAMDGRLVEVDFCRRRLQQTRSSIPMGPSLALTIPAPCSFSAAQSERLSLIPRRS